MEMDSTPTSTPVLRNPMETIDATVHFMRDVTVLVISKIAWHRHLCPESCFKKKRLLGVEFDILKKTDNIVVNYLRKNMAGALEALNLRYLDSLTMNIKNETGDFLLETYTVTYKYNGESPISLSSSTCSSKDSSPERTPLSRVYTETLDMLITLGKSLNDMHPLPDVLLDFRLSYYAHTPRDYIPPGFRFHTEEELENSGKYPEKTYRLRHGRINSGFGTLRFTSQFPKSFLSHSKLLE